MACKSEDVDFLWPPEWWNIAHGTYTATAMLTDARGKARLNLAAKGDGKFGPALEVSFSVADKRPRPLDIYIGD